MVQKTALVEISRSIVNKQTNSKDQIVLACATNDSFAQHATVMLISAIRKTRMLIHIYYLHDPNFPDSTKEKIRASIKRERDETEISFLPIPDVWVEGLRLFWTMKPGSMPPVMWYRVFLPQVLPSEPKIIYIDADALVVDDLEALWKTDVSNKALAAVSSPHWEQDDNWATEIGLPHRNSYFNSGVMVLNLEYFRKNKCTQKIVTHGKENTSWIRYGDQDSLCCVLHLDRVPLNPRWNLMRILTLTKSAREMFSDREIDNAIRKPGIIHFEGSTKPWENPYKHPYGKLYFKYASKLPWPYQKHGFSLADIDNFLFRHRMLRVRYLYRILIRLVDKTGLRRKCAGH